MATRLHLTRLLSTPISTELIEEMKPTNDSEERARGRRAVTPCIGGQSRLEAFTLVEILVVTAIIAILAALIFPALSGARVSANTVQCANNMRQIGAALIAYCGEHEGDFPTTMHTEDDEKKAWIYTLGPYLQRVDQVRICPSDPEGPQRLKDKGTSYILNEYIAVPSMDRFGNVKESPSNLRALASPARTLTAFIVADGSSSDHTHSRNWKAWNRVYTDICPDRHRSGKASKARDQGVANYLYADGHVAQIEASEFKKLIDEGQNPALPPK